MSDWSKSMKTRDLIALLVALPEDAKDFPVITEGCDCDGDVARVTVEEDTVVIERSYGMRNDDREREARRRAPA